MKEALRIAREVLRDIDGVKLLVKKTQSIKKYLIQLTTKGYIKEVDFYNITSLLTPQSRSALWQNYYMVKHKGQRVKAGEDSGDFIIDGVKYEYKGSGFNVDNMLHIVQVRLWQKCDYIVQSIHHDNITTFILTHSQMEAEIKRCNAQSAHGTKTANIMNRNVEMRLTFVIGGANWNRWIHLYAV